jgi:hypothetical protein
MEHFLQCVRTGARPRSDGASAVGVVRVLEGADAQMRELNRPL